MAPVKEALREAGKEKTMREILFRGKRVDNGEWIFGDLMQIPSYNIVRIFEQSNVARCETVNSNTVGQYTGLTDKNGTKIFEHDIVRIAVCGTYDNYVISYDTENARFVVGDTGFIFWNWNYISTKSEVIGNIHDNPELLEGRQ